MIVHTRIRGLKADLRKERKAGRTIGFVPTMGALHEGHLSIIRDSRSRDDITVCSIFVNPIQFNNKQDLEKYPRTLQQDLAMLEKEGCSYVFTPSVREMYPEGKVASPEVDFGYLDKILEGRFRPGHFKGVSIVVNKFLEIVGPDRAYFGKKDYQQLLIVKKMVRDLKIPVEIIPCPIMREKDGLAMSSRNMRLTIGERKQASLIYKVLTEVKEKASGSSVAELKLLAIKKLDDTPGFKTEYFEIADKDTLLPLDNLKKRETAIACTAVFVGDIRLIDNMELFP